MSVLWKLWYYVLMLISRWWRFNCDYWNFKGLISWSTNKINPAPIYDLNISKPKLLLVLQNIDMKTLITCGPIVFSFLFLTLILCFALLYFCVAQSEKLSFWMKIGAIKFFRKRTAWNIYLGYMSLTINEERENVLSLRILLQIKGLSFTNTKNGLNV